MCGSIVYIQSPTAGIRLGKKERRKIETTGQKYNGLPYYIGQTITSVYQYWYFVPFHIAVKY